MKKLLLFLLLSASVAYSQEYVVSPQWVYQTAVDSQWEVTQPRVVDGQYIWRSEEPFNKAQVDLFKSCLDVQLMETKEVEALVDKRGEPFIVIHKFTPELHKGGWYAKIEVEMGGESFVDLIEFAKSPEHVWEVAVSSIQTIYRDRAGVIVDLEIIEEAMP